MEWIVKHKKWFEITGWILFAVGVIWAWRAGLFTDTEKLQALLEKSGILAPLLFVIVQAVQVVIPIMPGAIGCVFGVVFFGALWGFVFNYIGICIGSVCAFLLARKYGMMFVQNMTGSKFYNKYQHFLEKENQFEKMFALLIFLPVAPDDFLCYLAGVSRMRLTRFTTIILLGKPAAILMYSTGLHQVLRMAMAHLAV
ncbi:sNARE associated Golgi protein-like protein [Clostridium sp. CAG:590]|nr:sNARE associated Golgi protein-like protein [Clostridium sp. CAG:590]